MARNLDILLDERERSRLDIGIIPETGQPVHFGLATEPGHLTLSVVAMRLLGRFQSLFAVDLTAQHLHCLLVPERCKGPRCIAISLS